MDFFEHTGKTAIGSRLRLLTDRITAEAAEIYAMYGVAIRPKWFPVFASLSDGQTKTITAIAREIGHSHPSVSNIVREMAARGLIETTESPNDGRCNAVRLTSEGEKTATVLRIQCGDVAAAVERIDLTARLWEAIGEWGRALSEKSLRQRVAEEKRSREEAEIRIVEFAPCYRAAFRSLNEAWITAHWSLEPADIAVLEHPERYILDRGGHIFIALRDQEPVGTCALCKSDDPHYDYELAKLAVSPYTQGRGIGRRLCLAALDRAKSAGAERIFLESNRLLRPAVNLYHKLGFRELEIPRPAYARGDIQMELIMECKPTER